jgi:cytochrome c
LIKTSDCFNCHAASTKLIGPSFQLIAAKYPGTGSVEALAGKLVKGSTGTWGNVPMPPHPNLSIADAKAIVLWILNNNRDPNATFFPGLQGAFRSRQKPAADASKAAYLLTASYTDHGLKGAPGSAKQGTHTIMLKAR